MTVVELPSRRTFRISCHSTEAVIEVNAGEDVALRRVIDGGPRRGVVSGAEILQAGRPPPLHLHLLPAINKDERSQVVLRCGRGRATCPVQLI